MTIWSCARTKRLLRETFEKCGGEFDPRTGDDCIHQTQRWGVIFKYWYISCQSLANSTDTIKDIVIRQIQARLDDWQLATSTTQHQLATLTTRPQLAMPTTVFEIRWRRDYESCRLRFILFELSLMSWVFQTSFVSASPVQNVKMRKDYRDLHYL